MIRASTLGRVLFSGLTWRIKGDSVQLTFDDGPHPEITPWVLDELDRYETSATFFLIGRNAEKHPRLVDDIRRRGHEIGNHTYAHLNGWKTPLRDYLADVDRWHEHVPASAGGETRSGFQRLGDRGLALFRPPYGRMTLAQMRALREKYDIMMWDVMPRDFDPRVLPGWVLSRIHAQARPGSIVVLHENDRAAKNLRVVLPKVLGWLQRTYPPITLNDRSAVRVVPSGAATLMSENQT